jgi:hypothetical protein
MNMFLSNGDLINDFVQDSVYTVVWNGTTYTTANYYFEEGYCMYGNIGAINGGDDSGEPFIVVNAAVLEDPDFAMKACIIPLDGTTELTISISGTVGAVSKIDKKYLPEEINSNLVNGIANGSLRGINATKEDTDYVLGENAIAIGVDTRANGIGAVALGIGTDAIGEYSCAAGDSATAKGHASFAAGRGIANGESSFASGRSVTNGRYSHADGGGHADGEASHAENSGVAYGYYSHAENDGEAIGKYSHAEGDGRAYGEFSHAEGAYTIAIGKNAHVEGESKNKLQLSLTGDANATTYTFSATGHSAYVNVGHYVYTKNRASKIIEKTDTTITVETTLSDTALENYPAYIYTHIASGEASHAEGQNNIASGIYSHAEGNSTIASNQSAHAEGIETVAHGLASHAEGGRTVASATYAHSEGVDSVASGHFSHAEGVLTKAIGQNSHAENSNTVAYGVASHAEGHDTIAYGLNSHAEGCGDTTHTLHISGEAQASNYSMDSYNGYESRLSKGSVLTIDGTKYVTVTDVNFDTRVITVNTPLSNEALNQTEVQFRTDGAIGYCSHAEGRGTLSYGTDSHAEGEKTYAYGAASHAEGGSAKAIGDYSHAEGLWTIAVGHTQHAQGEYNIEDSDNKYAHIVGNGVSDVQRSNAHTLDWEGNAWYAGDVYVKSTSGTHEDEGSKKLATEDYVKSYIETTLLGGAW